MGLVQCVPSLLIQPFSSLVDLDWKKPWGGTHFGAEFCGFVLSRKMCAPNSIKYSGAATVLDGLNYLGKSREGPRPKQPLGTGPKSIVVGVCGAWFGTISSGKEEGYFALKGLLSSEDI